MRIIFNPAEGAEIHDFISKGKLLDSHPIGELRQYEDNDAQALLETYEFLEEVSADKARSIQGKPKASDLKCEYCGKEFTVKLALAGHSRSHKNDPLPTVTEQKIDPALVQVAGSKKVMDQEETSRIVKEYEMKGDIPNGSDRDGIDWYGNGLTEERGSLSRVTPIGQKGHFGA